MKKSISKIPLIIALFLLTYYLTDAPAKAQDDSTHYVLPEFVVGSVKLKDGRTDSAIMNYNKLTEEMIFVKDGVLLAIDSLETIDTVNIDSRIFVPHQKIFYELLVKGPVSLFIQHKCNLLIAGNPSGYGGTTETGASKNISFLPSAGRAYKLKLPDGYHITDATQHWIRKDNKFYKANTTSQITKVFPEKEKEIKQFIKVNKLDLKKSDDMIKLIVKCNEFVI
jgi:hypothetical protein